MIMENKTDGKVVVEVSRKLYDGVVGAYEDYREAFRSAVEGGTQADYNAAHDRFTVQARTLASLVGEIADAAIKPASKDAFGRVDMKTSWLGGWEASLVFGLGGSMNYSADTFDAVRDIALRTVQSTHPTARLRPLFKSDNRYSAEIVVMTTDQAKLHDAVEAGLVPELKVAVPDVPTVAMMNERFGRPKSAPSRPSLTDVCRLIVNKHLHEKDVWVGSLSNNADWRIARLFQSRGAAIDWCKDVAKVTFPGCTIVDKPDWSDTPRWEAAVMVGTAPWQAAPVAPTPDGGRALDLYGEAAYQASKAAPLPPGKYNAKQVATLTVTRRRGGSGFVAEYHAPAERSDQKEAKVRMVFKRHFMAVEWLTNRAKKNHPQAQLVVAFNMPNNDTATYFASVIEVLPNG